MKPITKTIIMILILLILGITLVISPSSIRQKKVSEILGIPVVENKAEPLSVPVKPNNENKDKVVQAKADLNFASSGGIKKIDLSIDKELSPTPIPQEATTEIKQETLSMEIDKEKQIENRIESHETFQLTPTPAPTPTKTPLPSITQIPEKHSDKLIQSSKPDIDIEIISEEEAEDFQKIGKIRRENGVTVPILLASYTPEFVEEAVIQGSIKLLIRKKESGNVFYRVIPNNGYLLVNQSFIIVTNETMKSISERGIEMNEEYKATYFSPLIRAFREHIRNWDQDIQLLIHVPKSIDAEFARKQSRAVFAVETRYKVDISWMKDIIMTHGNLVLKDSRIDYDIDKISIIDPSLRKKKTYFLDQSGSGR